VKRVLNTDDLAGKFELGMVKKLFSNLNSKISLACWWRFCSVGQFSDLRMSVMLSL